MRFNGSISPNKSREKKTQLLFSYNVSSDPNPSPAGCSDLSSRSVCRVVTLVIVGRNRRNEQRRKTL